MLIFLGFLEISSGFLGIFWDFLGSWLVNCMGFSPSDLPLDLFAHDFSDIWIRKSQYSTGGRGRQIRKTEGAPIMIMPLCHSRKSCQLATEDETNSTCSGTIST